MKALKLFVFSAWLARWTLERWYTMYICEPGLYVTSRLNRSRWSSILCNPHGAAYTDFLKMAWSGLWSDCTVNFSRRDMYWLKLWQANTIAKHSFSIWAYRLSVGGCFWCKLLTVDSSEEGLRPILFRLHEIKGWLLRCNHNTWATSFFTSLKAVKLSPLEVVLHLWVAAETLKDSWRTREDSTLLVCVMAEAFPLQLSLSQDLVSVLPYRWRVK